MKLITTVFSITPGKADRLVKIYFDEDVQEYICKLFVAGKHEGPGNDYYTDDKADAVATSKLIIEGK